MNHRAQRYNWVCGKLYMEADGEGGRKLVCSEIGATVEKSLVPKYIDTPIPQGKSNMEERSQLRKTTEHLEKCRALNILKKDKAREKKFVDDVQAMQADRDKRVKERKNRIESERR